MSGASLDRLLAILIAAVAATGLLALRAGTPDAGWVFSWHDLFAGMLAAAVVLKIRGSVPRAAAAARWRPLALALLLSLTAIGALAGGYLWVVSAGRPSIGGWTALTLHAWAGIALAPLLVVHLAARRWRLLKPGTDVIASTRQRLLSRRAFILGTGFGVIAVGTWLGSDLIDAWRGGNRRFTGSRLLPSGGIPPSTTFLGDSVPAIDPAAWRLRIHGRVTRDLVLTTAQLAEYGEVERTATLDCTSGWALETRWRGAPLSTLLEAAGIDPAARGIVVRSVTGWATTLPLPEARACLLATAVAGVPLPSVNGGPCRLVAPSRRGLDWVKWVAEVEVT